MTRSQQPNPPIWRAMGPADLDYVLRLAAELYPCHPESRAAFAVKLESTPDACRIAERDGRPVGYCAALWATRGRPPKLDEAGYRPLAPHTLHLHDLAIDPAARGLGLTAAALAHLARIAGGKTLSLIAVNGTRELWRRHGFAEAAVDEDVRATYGADAAYMERTP